MAESAVELVQNGIIMQTIGPDGMRYTPYLLTLFSFILACNLIGLLPGLQMPVMARFALPVFMALVTYFIYNIVGIIKQGPLKYLKNVMFMPGVPKGMYVLLTPIETASTSSFSRSRSPYDSSPTCSPVTSSS